jgi:hypothetical protein
MNRKAIFEDLATAQVGRAQSRRIRLEPDGVFNNLGGAGGGSGKQQEQRSLMVIYDKQKNNYLYDLNSGEIWNRKTYTWDPQADYAGQLFYTVDNQLFSPLGEVEVKDKRDVGEDDGGGQISIDESHNRIGFVPLDVGSNYGAFQMANYRADIRIRGNQNNIFVGVTNSNTPVSGGQVVFTASALLVVDGNAIQKQVLNNGSARFELPNVSNVSLTIEGGWTVYFDSGGSSVPVYLPIFWPFSLNFKDEFKIK